jgi:hypothetical protein
MAKSRCLIPEREPELQMLEGIDGSQPRPSAIQQ